MTSGVDVALIGTGVAPLVAARILLDQGARVAILNPDRDFFLEDSELALDPLLLDRGVPQDLERRLKLLDPKRAIEVLEPVYPGAIESLPRVQGSFFDLEAPWVRARAWTWLPAGIDPAALQSFVSELKTSGQTPVAARGGHTLPRCADVDVRAYRIGIADFLREKLGSLFIHPVSQIEVVPTGARGLRYWRDGKRESLQVEKRVIIFVTPRLGLLARQVFPGLKLGEAVWEEWSLVSRDPLPVDQVVMTHNMLAYCVSERETDLLRVLRYGRAADGVAGEPSFRDLWTLARGHLGWEKFSVRSMTARQTYEAQGLPVQVAAAGRLESLVVGVVPAEGGLVPLVESVAQILSNLSQEGA